MTDEQILILIEQNEELIARVTEITTAIGNIQGYAIFGVTVVIFYFAYKFLRMFF